MKILAITEDRILFDNGKAITYEHAQDCCEHNYALFDALEPLARTVEFKDKLVFEEVKGAGFRFGNLPNKMFFVPCYSDQNGYYSTQLSICYNGKEVLDMYDLEYNN